MTGAGEWSTSRIEAQMASAAERDELRARVTVLEAEVSTLRAALADVLRAAADGLDTNIDDRTVNG